MDLDAIADRGAAEPVSEARGDLLTISVVGEKHRARRQLTAQMR
jgi:hypothetical protein